MNLSGTLAFDLPRNVVVAGFDDPDILRVLLPRQSQLTRTRPGAFDFVLIQSAGAMTIRLPGTLTVTPQDSGLRLLATAKQLIAGSATLSLRLSMTAQGDGCAVQFDGTLDSTGLIGRLLKDRGDQVQQAVQARFAAVRAALETSHGLRSGPV